MRVLLNGRPRELRALWWEREALRVLDQRLLPRRVELRDLRTVEEVASAIADMTVRGAPTIGAAAAFGMALGAADPERASSILRATRPTAVNLAHGVEHVHEAIRRGEDPLAAAQAYADGVVEACRRIGEAGLPLVKDGARILTHCNAGALATVDLGTATAPLRLAARQGRRFSVLCDETRPRLQGHLTAWELLNEGIDARVVADNAAGWFLSRSEVDLVIVGADRVAQNGDVANKIGTYEKAVLAREHGVPFYVALPASTYDPATPSGAGIAIEERDESEVLELAGVRVAPEGVRAHNPAFDVTPAKYVTGYLTERGLLMAKELPSLSAAKPRSPPPSGRRA
ncbi:MAG TPA: S-methyl-5-thioribose-1-phosphate isomerase [Candidatus Thermoplasmatota archaeon]|nr:S-methyl-5-thioribose-1-phosphate isomerase [Candidatus Thermoplasmatota archaeon]